MLDFETLCLSLLLFFAALSLMSHNFLPSSVSTLLVFFTLVDVLAEHFDGNVLETAFKGKSSSLEESDEHLLHDSELEDVSES